MYIDEREFLAIARLVETLSERYLHHDIPTVHITGSGSSRHLIRIGNGSPSHPRQVDRNLSRALHPWKNSGFEKLLCDLRRFLVDH